MIRSILSSVLFAGAFHCSFAQEASHAAADESPAVDMTTLFREMPDSLLPYLTTNNRLDMIDFLEAKMKAEVTNMLDGQTELTYLDADSLSLQMNGSMRIDMKLIPLQEAQDSSMVGIRLWRTYIVNEKEAETIVETYSSAWRRLSSSVYRSFLLRQDEEIFKD